jgi:flagellar biosynthetic protein FliR
MTIGAQTVLAVFVLFCRIGTCIMLMPGFSSSRVPGLIRLFLAFGVTLVLTPLLVPGVEAALSPLTLQTVAGILISEMLVGGMLGILGRLFFFALETLAHAMTMAIGLSAMPGTGIDEPEPEPALVSLVTISALVLLFVTNQHWTILRGLAGSYEALPVAQIVGAQPALMRLADGLTDAFLAALRITSPFIIYAVVVNFALGLTNKLTPQIPVYFISLPFIVFGGLLLLYFVAPEMLHLFIDGFSSWLAEGWL